MTEKMGFEKQRFRKQYGEPCEGFGVLFRSKEERKWATYLELLRKSSGEVVEWHYESTTFEFLERHRMRHQYTPDFEVLWAGGDVRYYEVKAGFRDWQKAVYKFKQFRLDFPHEWLTLVFPSCPQRSPSRLIKLDKARKYVNEIIYSGPIFRKLGL